MHNYGHWKKTLALLVMSALSLGASSVDAMPEGGVIRSGEGAVTQNGKEMTIRQDSGRLAMDWTNFNVGKDETVRFQQPGKDALALNRVTGNQQSVIDGSLLSNGHVLLVNPNGVVIGKNASIDVGGLVASTAHVKDNFMKEFGNSTGAFTLGGVSDGKIINEGTINAEGGLVALHAAKVENSGTITSNGGSVLMAAADTLTLTPDTDGKLNFTVDGKVAEASALNKGAITADGGTIVMTADSASDVMSTVVNNEGTLQARTLRKNEKGQILLEGNDKGQVEVSGTLDASGTDDGQDAGNIKVIGQKTIVHDGTNLLAKGDVNGGKIETSGDVLDLGDNLNIDAKGVNGKAGEWLLDPLDVIIADSDPTGTSNYDGAEKKEASDSDFLTFTGTNTRTDLIGYNDPTATSSNAQDVFNAVTWVPTSIVKTMLEAGTNVRIQAVANNGSANIIVKNNIEKTSGDDATLTLEAMRNITINGNITATGENNKLNVILNADTNGDATGAVIINADIKTNGGNFTSASGGKVTYAGNGTAGYGNGTLGGEADSTGHTVGTYFGHVDSSGTADGAKDNRLIKTSGGKITLNGEVAIGLDGGTLTLDSGGGNVSVTGIINSGNSYGAYVYGTDTWNTLVEKTVESYLQSGSVPAYHYQGVNYQRKIKTNADGSYVKDKNGNYVYEKDSQRHYIYLKDDNGNYLLDTTTTTDEKGNTVIVYNSQYYSSGDPHYTFSEADTQNVRWLGDGSSTAVSTNPGTGYSSVIITKGSMTLEQWLNYQLTYNAANFANRYISKDSGVTIVTETVGNKTNTYVRNADGSNVTAAQFKTYLSTALASLKSDTASTDTTKMLNGETVYNNLKDDISHLLATNWFASKDLAQGSTGGGSAVEDSYLATITTILENSLTTPNGQQILWAGGRGSGVLNKFGSTNNDKAYPYSYYGLPDDPTYQNGMYWVTGPEGKANNKKGTQFYSNVGSNWANKKYGETVYGYANWDTYKENNGTVTRYQPDNSSPFLTVGYGTTGKWDDAAMGGDTTVGFIKETNLANSSLNIKAGSGAVSLGGDIGKAKALDTVNIESIGAVKVGDTSNTATEYHNGTIYADHGVYINGSDVTVGGEIHSGGSSIEATRNTTWVGTDADKMDNVTINASRNLTVHGIESNGYTTSSTDAEGNTTSTTAGGKIKLVSTATATGTEGVGVITLGDGVDYNGNNTNGGVLKAASTAQGAVVIDAQGSNGGFVNKTSAEKKKAIDTNGTWQVYSASPDKDIFGTNLNSGTDAQWTSKSASNTIATENKYGKNPNNYSDTSSNKFIFQATPVITLYSEDYLKTYGDEVSADTLKKLLKGKEVFTGLDEKTHNVTDYSSAFQEQDYNKYISGKDTVTITSDGSAATATRNGGKYEATEKSGADGKNAVYDLTVNLNDAKALDGYAINKENGKLEIKKRTASITGKGTQTYGDTDSKIKNWTVTQNTIANGSTASYTTSVKSGSAYTYNQKGRNTADFGTYENSVSFDNLKITDSNKNEVNIADNYDLTTTGTIDVAKAKLIVNTDGKTTTYGTVDEDYKSSLDKTTQALNGDKEADLLKELGLTYTLDPKDSAYIDSDGDGKYDRTNHVKYTSDGKNYDSYTLDVANTNTLKNYEVTVNDSTVTLERAKATVDTDKVTTDYGKVDTSYTSHFKDALNGDKEEDLLKQLNLSYSTDAYKDADHTNNVKDGGYDLKVQAKGSLNYNDYDVTVNDSNVTLNKVNLTVNPEDIHRIYGQAKEVQEDAKTAYNLSGFANGDTKDTVDKDGKTIDQLVKVTNDVSKALKDDGTHTQNASAAGYDMETTASGDLTNYNIVVGDSKKVYLDKAALVVDTTGNTRTYGDVTNVSTDVANAASFHLAGGTNQTVNGDSYDDILKEMKLSTNSGALVTGEDGKVKTGNANTDPGYDIKAAFKNDLTNYTVTEGVVGKEKIEKADLTLKLRDVSTTYGQGFDEETYGYEKDKDDLKGLTNGDDAKAITDVLRDSDFTYVNGGAKSDPNNENVKTQDAGSSYRITGTTSKTLDNYNIMVNPGNSTVSKKAITVENEMNQIYGEKDSTTFSEIVLPDLPNGDKLDTSKDSKFTISLSEDPNTQYNQNRKNRDTADVGEYADSLKYSGGGIVHSDGTDAYENYDVTIKGIAKVHPKDIYTEVIGKGSTLNDLTWTILKDPKDQMANGDSVNFTYKPGNLISYDDQTFDVNSFINGTQTYGSTTDVDPYGKNYIFHSTGIVQLTFNPIVKPDVWAHSGGYRPRNKIETSLPVFRVEDAKVGQYGTYGVEHREDEDKLVLSATGMRLPEPDQVPDEERTFTTTLSTSEGSGTFKLVYNGVSLKVHPQDKKAEEVVRAGDKTKNVSLSEKALYVGYTEMGLDLIDLKGVYIYFN